MTTALRPWRHAMYALAALTIYVPQLSAQEIQPSPAIVAQGEAVVKHAADVAYVQIAVEARGTRPEDARRQAATAMTSVLNGLRRSVPGDAIKTSGFSVHPEMEYPDNRPRVRGYVARNQVDVRVDDLEKLPAVLDASVAGGATSIAGLRFDLKRRDEAEREALRLAVEDAMARADAIARGARRSLGGILRIEEQRLGGGPIPMQRMTMDMAAQGGSSTPIAPGEVEIRAQVTATVGLR